MERKKSKEAFERSKLNFAGVICSGVRLRELPEPVFIESGQGSRFKDIDGNEYIDYVLSYGPLILGHCPRVVVDAVIQQLAKGTMFAGCCELDFLVSEEMVRMVPGLDLVHFTNSGTESLHFVLRLARAYTGRDKVIKFEGHYHGWTDELNISVKPSPPMGARNAPWKMREAAGVPENVGDNLVILPWNDLGIVERTLKERDHEIAAIIMEPIMTNSGGILPQEEYIHGVRELTTKHGVVLIFDEVVTGFRVALGGAQEYLGVMSDLCVFAKGFAAGYPIAAFGGRREIMNLVATNEVAHPGTYNANPLCLAAALATLRELSKNNGQAIRHISAMGAKLRSGLEGLFKRYNFPMKTSGTDAIFVLNSPVVELRDYRDCLRIDLDFIHQFHTEMFHEGIWFMRRGNVLMSAAHTDKDIEETLEAAERVIKRWTYKK